MKGASSAATSARLRLLFLLPFPPDLEGNHGGARATAAIVEGLARRHEVSALYFAPPEFTSFIRAPSGCQHLIGVPSPPRSPKVPKSFGARALSTLRMLLYAKPDWLRETWSLKMASESVKLANKIQPHVVHFEFHVMSQYLPLTRNAAPDAALIVTEHEPGIIAAAEHGASSKSMMQRLGRLARERSWWRFERKALRRADAVITFTQKDRNAILRLLRPSPPPVACIPLRLMPRRDEAGEMQSVKSDLLFVGNFRHPPNVDAAERLTQRIFPIVRKAIPSATLFIVGAAPPPGLDAAAGAGVIVTGEVPDVLPYLRGTSVVMAPLRTGGGLRIKVIEACIAGKAIVGSATAAEGLSLQDGVEFIAAKTDDEFAEAAIELLRDRKARERLGNAARKWAERTQDVDAWMDEYDALYAQLIDPDRRRTLQGTAT